MKKILIVTVKILIAAIILFYIIKYIHGNIQELSDFRFSVHYGYLLASILVLLLNILYMPVIWYYITYKNKCHLNFRRTIVVRMYAEFGKYIPGRLWGYAMLLYTYKSANKPGNKVLFSSYLEQITSILGALIVFAGSFYFGEIGILENYKYVSLVLIPFLILSAHPKILGYILNKVLSLLKKNTVRLEISYKEIIFTILLYTFNWIIFGIAFYIFIYSFFPVETKYLVYITGSFAISSVIGFIAIITPAGLGVREGVLVFLLANIIPKSLAGIVSILSRLWLIFGEVFIFFIIFISVKMKGIKRFFSSIKIL